MIQFDFINCKNGKISEPLKAMYRMFLEYGAWVSEKNWSYNPDGASTTEVIAIVSADGLYRVEVTLRNPGGFVDMRVEERPRNESIYNNDPIFIV